MRFLLFTLFLGISSLGYTQSNYSDQRMRADRHPKTIAARSEFKSFINHQFLVFKKKYNLPYLDLTFNDRMIAQYGRGLKSAKTEISKELENLIKLIRDSKKNRSNLLKDLGQTYKTLRQYSDFEIDTVINIIADAEIVHLDYWGYLGGRLMPKFDNKSKTLSYFSEWNNKGKIYKAAHERQLRSNIVRGIMKQLTYTPWYKKLFN